MDNLAEKRYYFTMKTCSQCLIEKPLTDFYAKKANQNGIQSECKVCHNARVAAARKANPEREKARVAAWSAANPGRVAATTAAWAKANPARCSALVAAWNKANPERVKANGAAYRKAYPERVKAATAAWAKANPKRRCINEHNRRAIKEASGGKLSSGLATKLFKQQKGLCPCCGQPLGKDYHLDHIMPLSLGGANVDSNIQLLRAKCNLQKRNKHPIDFMQSRGFLL